MREEFEALKALNNIRRSAKEYDRRRYAIEKLENYHLVITESKARILHKCGVINFWFYTGWFQGQKPIGHIKGRGIHNLIKILKELDI